MMRSLYIGIAVSILSMAAAYKVTSNYYVAEITKIELAQTQDKLAAEKANTSQLLAVQSLADVLSNSLANKEAENAQLILEKTREIHHYATGNTCFNAGLTKLLNTNNSDLQGLTEAPSTPAAKDEATAAIDAQSNTLTDGDVAEWVANAQGQYETCRARLGALIDFNTTDITKDIKHD